MAPAAFREQDASVISIDPAKASLYPPTVDTTKVRKSRCRRDSVKILLKTSASVFVAHFGLLFVLCSSTIAFILNKHFRLHFKFGGSLGF